MDFFHDEKYCIIQLKLPGNHGLVW